MSLEHFGLNNKTSARVSVFRGGNMDTWKRLPEESMAFMIALNYVNPIELVEDLDRKFKLTLLTDRNGGFIKVVE